jgi:hypothetical protein
LLKIVADVLQKAAHRAGQSVPAVEPKYKIAASRLFRICLAKNWRLASILVHGSARGSFLHCTLRHCSKTPNVAAAYGGAQRSAAEKPAKAWS